MTQIQILINIQFNNDVIFKYLWIYVLYNNYANSSEPSFYEGAHQRGCPKQMGRWTSLHQVEGSVLLPIRLRANTSQKNHHFFCNFFDQIPHHSCNLRHQDMAEDLRLRPEWNQYTPQYSFFLRDADRPSPCDE